MVIMKKSLSRRTVLRGIGAAIGLPLLDGMVPAFAAAPAPVKRLGAVYCPNGMSMPFWTPKAEGNLELSPIDGDAVRKVIAQMATTPADVLAQFKAVAGTKN